MDTVEGLLSSVAEVFERSEQKQKTCNNGLLFVERMAASGYREPAQVIIDFLRPLYEIEGSWILATSVVLGLGNACGMLLKAGADLRNTDWRGYTPLHTAVERNKVELVRVLLDAGMSSPDEPAAGCDTLLIVAARTGSVGCMRVLLESGACVNMTSYEGDSPLHFSAWRGDMECLRLLLECDGLELDMENDRGYTPLMKAVEFERIECVRLLLAAGANVRQKNRGAVHIAAFRNCPDILRLLVEAGAPFDSATLTPLHVAASTHALESLQLLIALGASPNARAEDGATPLHLAVESEKLRYGRLVRLPKEETARWDKIIRGEFRSMQMECVQALVAGGADVNACMKSSVSVLHTCSDNGNPACMRKLLEAGADTSVTCSEGRTALHYAAKGPSPEALKLLVKAGVSVNERDKKGKTALHVAAQFPSIDSIANSLDCMEALVNAGADVKVTACLECTPLALLLQTAHDVDFINEYQRGILRKCVYLLGSEDTDMSIVALSFLERYPVEFSEDEYPEEYERDW